MEWSHSKPKPNFCGTESYIAVFTYPDLDHTNPVHNPIMYFINIFIITTTIISNTTAHCGTWLPIL
jgi:hypothetical protein